VTTEPRYRWVSDHGVLVSFGDEPSELVRERVLAAAEAIAAAGVAGLRNLHPAYTSVLAVCDPLAGPAEAFEAGVRRAVSGAPEGSRGERRLVEIPVCYDPDFGPDLEEVARLHGLTPAEAARLHASAGYVVAFLGFTPGFPYLDGLPAELATPRLAAPRKRVPAGSVAIGGSQAGIYPFATPGGWRLIGRTALSLFRADRDPPSLLRPGDRVRFVPVSREELAERAT
jgi:KipI family sensor histidine kinase inhibitor